MAFKPKNMNSRNPTGDRAFNGITRIVHGPPTDPAEQADTDAGPVSPAPSGPPAPGGKPQPKRMGGAKKYSTATHSFHNC